jgi:hypothetical protein
VSRPGAAAERLAAARRRTSDKVMRLAYHAALPVVIDPGLLNLLRVNFFLDPPDAIPFEDEATLLLSPLFREIGDDLYEIDPQTRNLLLIGLNTKYGMTRVRQVALLLERYTLSMPSWNAQPELEQAQLLTALSFTDPRRAEAWLRDTHTGARTGTLGREWFVAMRQSLADQVAGVTAEDQVAATSTRLSSADLTERQDAIRSLAALARLPDTDPGSIVAVLAEFIRSSVATPASAEPRADIQSALSLIRSLPHPAGLEEELFRTEPRVSSDSAVRATAGDVARSASQSAEELPKPVSPRRPVYQSYSRLIRDNLGYLPTWPPTMKIQVGDIGVLRSNVFIPEGHVSQFDISIEATTSPNMANVTISSGTDITISPASATQYYSSGL